jgi:hypothetical protein
MGNTAAADVEADEGPDSPKAALRPNSGHPGRKAMIQKAALGEYRVRISQVSG